MSSRLLIFPYLLYTIGIYTYLLPVTIKYLAHIFVQAPTGRISYLAKYSYLAINGIHAERC